MLKINPNNTFNLRNNFSDLIGAGGVHIVLPSYYAPASIGMVDMSTSDGRFLFFIPWAGHVLVGERKYRVFNLSTE